MPNTFSPNNNCWLQALGANNAQATSESFVKSLLDAGAPAGLARYLALLFGFVRQGATATVSAAVEQLTGRPPRTLAQYAQDHASAWK